MPCRSLSLAFCFQGWRVVFIPGVQDSTERRGAQICNGDCWTLETLKNWGERQACKTTQWVRAVSTAWFSSSCMPARPSSRTCPLKVADTKYQRLRCLEFQQRITWRTAAQSFCRLINYWLHLWSPWLAGISRIHFSLSCRLYGIGLGQLVISAAKALPTDG